MNKILYHPTPGTTGFFRAMNVPTDPNLIIDYYNKMKACKEEAIKNGEITNPEELYNVQAFQDEFLNWSYVVSNKELQSGDMFDVPDGLIVQIVNDPKELDRLESEGKEVSAMRGRSHIRLVPSKKEEKVKPETQEELMDALISKYRKMRKTGATVYSIELNLMTDFTITRNSK